MEEVCVRLLSFPQDKHWYIRLLHLERPNAVVVYAVDRAVDAVSIHVKPDKSLPRRNVPIRRDKSARVGVVVAGIEVVKRSFGIVVVPAVAEGVVGSLPVLIVTCFL